MSAMLPPLCPVFKINCALREPSKMAATEKPACFTCRQVHVQASLHHLSFLQLLYQPSDTPLRVRVGRSWWCDNIVQVSHPIILLEKHQVHFFLYTLVTFTFCKPPSQWDIKKLRLLQLYRLCVGDGLREIPSATCLLPLPGHKIQHSVPVSNRPLP